MKKVYECRFFWSYLLFAELFINFSWWLRGRAKLIERRRQFTNHLKMSIKTLFISLQNFLKSH